MVLRHTTSTTCIRSDNHDLIEEAITRILEQEGYRRIPKPPLPPNPEPLLDELLFYRRWKMYRYLWVVGLYLGNLGWTVVDTYPGELFCRRAEGAIRPRLSELAKQVGCEAFHYEVHDSDWGALLEADAFGRTFTSGDLNCYGVENMKFHDEPILERTGNPEFYLLNVSEELRAAFSVKVNHEEREKRLKELETLCEQEGEQGDEARSERDELLKGGFEIGDEALGRLLVGSDHFEDYWYRGINLLFRAYADSQQLEADGVRLLFFQVGEFERRPDTEEIWEPITKSKDYGIEPDIPF